MFRKLLLMSVVVFSSIYFSACTDDPSELGSALVSQDLVGLDSLDSYKDTLPQTSSNYKFETSLGASQMLLLGKNTANGVTNEAYTVLSFYFGLQDTIKTYLLSNSLKVVSATIELDASYKIGNPVPGFSFTGHKVNKGWTAAGFIIDSLDRIEPDYGNNSITGGPRFSNNDSTMVFDVDTALVQYWLLAEADPGLPYDNGILLKPVSSGGILGFNSISSGYADKVPVLTVKVNKAGWDSVRTLTFTPAVDISVVKGDVPVSTENIFLQTSVLLNSILKFDLSKLPEHAVINYAQLELTADTNLTVKGDNYTDALYASLFSNASHPDTTVTGNIALNRSGVVYKGNITSFVQKWISTKENNGILLRTVDLNNRGVDMFAIKSSTAADPAVRPRLKIIYTNKK